MGQLKEVLAVCQYGVVLWLLGCHLMAEGLREGEGKDEGEMEEEGCLYLKLGGSIIHSPSPRALTQRILHTHPAHTPYAPLSGAEVHWTSSGEGCIWSSSHCASIHSIMSTYPSSNSPAAYTRPVNTSKYYEMWLEPKLSHARYAVH